MKGSRQLGALLREKLRKRIREVGAGMVEAGRQAKAAYREKRRQAAPPLDPRLAGYYANLEVEAGADLETLTRAFKRLVREYHPDRFAADPAKQAAATRLVQDLNHAYHQLVAHLSEGK